MNTIPSTITVICPKHGEHEHAIVSNIPGHEGVWCQICWTESMGESLPYKRNSITPETAEPDRNSITADSFLTMDETIPIPEVGWQTLPKE